MHPPVTVVSRLLSCVTCHGMSFLAQLAQQQHFDMQALVHYHVFTAGDMYCLLAKVCCVMHRLTGSFSLT